MKEKAKKFAKLYGFKLHKVSNSLKFPNGYIKITYPSNVVIVGDWLDALSYMQNKVFSKAQ